MAVCGQPSLALTGSGMAKALMVILDIRWHASPNAHTVFFGEQGGVPLFKIPLHSGASSSSHNNNGLSTQTKDMHTCAFRCIQCIVAVCLELCSHTCSCAPWRWTRRQLLGNQTWCWSEWATCCTNRLCYIRKLHPEVHWMIISLVNTVHILWALRTASCTYMYYTGALNGYAKL